MQICTIALSLRGGTFVSGEQSVEFGFPRCHILWRSPDEHAVAGLLHEIFILKSFLDLIVLLVVLLILLEYLWVLR